MHWVDRGPEPPELADIRYSYTPRWVQYYQDRIGSKPTDSHWRKFIDDLDQVFYGLCAYCEETCRGEVDHFQPKSRFPDLVYEWTNWLFTCHDCNHSKLEKSPIGGYVDPCAESSSDRPEQYFTFDTITGEMLPRKELTASQREKAISVIKDLGLNNRHHLKSRCFRLWLLSVQEQPPSEAIPNELKWFFSNVEEARASLASRSSSLSSITRCWLSARGYTPAN